jgi:hypothetical protein
MQHHRAGAGPKNNGLKSTVQVFEKHKNYAAFRLC